MLYGNLSCARIEPTLQHTATVIFCHGLGDCGENVLELFRSISFSTPNVRYLFPNAPVRPVTCNGGARMSAWYDIHQLMPGTTSIASQQDEEGILRSRELLLSVIRQESSLSPGRIVLGGFSQGAAIALAAGLSPIVNDRIGGIFCWSGYLPIHQTLLKNADSGTAEFKEGTRKVTDTLIHFYHGTSDPLIPVALAEKSVDLLKMSHFSNVFLSKYKGLQHSFCEEELVDVAKFIKEILR